MQIETSTVNKLLIKEVPSLDPITVFLEDYGQNRGRMIVECYGRSWSAYWGGMGGTLTHFLKGVSSDYVANCMFHGQVHIYDSEGLEAQLKKEVLKRRYKRDLSQQEAFDLMYQIETSDFDAPFHLNHQMMVDLIGDDWHVCLPQCTNSDFAYLLRIIDAVRAAVAQTYPEKPDEKQ